MTSLDDLVDFVGEIPVGTTSVFTLSLGVTLWLMVAIVPNKNALRTVIDFVLGGVMPSVVLAVAYGISLFGYSCNPGQCKCVWGAVHASWMFFFASIPLTSVLVHLYPDVPH